MSGIVCLCCSVHYAVQTRIIYGRSEANHTEWPSQVSLYSTLFSFIWSPSSLQSVCLSLPYIAPSKLPATFHAWCFNSLSISFKVPSLLTWIWPKWGVKVDRQLLKNGWVRCLRFYINAFWSRCRTEDLRALVKGMVLWWRDETWPREEPIKFGCGAGSRVRTTTYNMQ